MKRMILPALCIAALQMHAQGTIREGFLNPPMECRPSTYWEWMNGNISCEGIKEDLIYMKKAGYGAVQMFNVGVGIPRGKMDYGSREWVMATRRALQVADSLGMKLMMHNAPGYSGTSGKWITPEVSMKQLVWTDSIAKFGYYEDVCYLAYPCQWTEANNTFVIGKRLMEDVPYVIEIKPTEHLGGLQIWRGEREKPLDPHDGPRDYAPNVRIELSADGKQWHDVGTANCPYLRSLDMPGELSFAKEKVAACGKVRYIRLTPNRDTNIDRINTYDDCVPDVADIRVVYNKKDALAMQRKGWQIVRFGMTTTGETGAAAPDSGIGLECNKMSREGIDTHFAEFLEPLFKELQPYVGTTLEGLVIDSWEAGKQTWTKRMPEEFMKRRGYDMMPYLLSLTGRKISGDKDFAKDYERTQKDLFIDEYVKPFVEHCHEHGLKYAGEPYGDGNFDSDEFAEYQDIQMSELWTHYIYGSIHNTWRAESVTRRRDKTYPDPPVNGRKERNDDDDRGLATQLACEIYTGTPFTSKFTEHPYGMKALGDWAMTQGVNRFVYHATTHQPYTGPSQMSILPMGPFGTHLDRASIWGLRPFRAFNDYISRVCYMLRQGVCVSNDHDHNEDEFRYTATHRDAIIHYQHRVLKDSDLTDIYFISNRLRRKELVTVSIPQCDGTPELWNPEDGTMGKAIEYSIEDDRMVFNLDLEKSGSALIVMRSGEGNRIKETVKRMPVTAPVREEWHCTVKPETFAANGRGFVMWPKSNDIGVAVGTNGIKVWHADEKGHRTVIINDETQIAGVVKIALKRDKDGHIVLLRDNKVIAVSTVAYGKEKARFTTDNPIPEDQQICLFEGDKIYEDENDNENATLCVASPWKVTFPAWSKANEITLDTLTSLSLHTDYDVRHFSGTCSYSTTVDISKKDIKSPKLVLALGRVENIAEVIVNASTDTLLLWKPPYEVDIKPYLHKGSNNIEVRITNCLANRLIGDASLNDPYEYDEYGRMTTLPQWYTDNTADPNRTEGDKSAKVIFIPWRYYTADTPLFDSGLIGPVMLKK